MANVTGPRPSAPRGSGPRALSPILVVEDDPVSAAMITRHLAALGLANPVHRAEDGDEAVAWLTDSLEQPTGTIPALILLDRHLPRRDGFAVLRWIHGQPRLQPIPLLILTAGSDVGAISEAYALGVRSYLVKPIGFEALGEVVRALELRWAILSPEQAR